MELSHTLGKLLNLETLYFPRAGKERYEILFSCWPENLRKCVVTGGLKSGNFTEGAWTDRNHDPVYYLPKRQPHNLTHLTISNCDQLWASDIEAIVNMEYLPKLEYLNIQGPMFQLVRWPIDSHIFSISTLRHLRTPARFISGMFKGPREWSGSGPYPLDTLELDHEDFSATGMEPIVYDWMWDAIAEGPFKNLRRVGVDRRLVHPYYLEPDHDQFAQYLKALAREDGKTARYTEDQAGVWIFGGGE